MKNLIFLLCIIICFTACDSEKSGIKVYVNQTTIETEYFLTNVNKLFPEVQFKQVLKKPTQGVIINIVKSNVEQIDSVHISGIEENGFSLSKQGEILRIYSVDGIGAMYGLMEVAEQLSFNVDLADIENKIINPSLKNRVVKFNLPWSSYRQAESLSLHYETCRDTVYWESFLNMMAKNRLNVLSLWNLHPFVYMIKPEKYPEASPFSDEEMLEWKAFWNKLLGMAKERGIQTYIVNWNIFVSKEFAEAQNNPNHSRADHFWGDADKSELIEDYTRECVKQVINEYPDLTGLGLTLGERMGTMTPTERRDWVSRTVLSGMAQADRKAKLLYRAPLSAGLTSHGTTSKSTEIITRELLDTLSIAEELIISFKYNWSHGHSSDKLFIVHGGKLSDTYWNPLPKNYSVLWTVRNEDFFTLRWAQPDFVRSFLSNNRADYTSGCIVGSECYIPAKDYLSNEEAEFAYDYAFERQWLWYSIWGRLLYDNNTDDDLFANQLNSKFSIDFGDELLNTWKLASDYYHRFGSFYMGTWDATVYAEAFTGRYTNRPEVITMAGLAAHPVLDTVKYVNIEDYIRSKHSLADEIITPIELMDILKTNGNKVLEDLENYKADKQISKELEIELTDLEILGNMQLFFAKRIEATLNYTESIVAGKDVRNRKLDETLKESIELWKEITYLKERFNKVEIPYVFSENISYSKHLETLEKELLNYHENPIFHVANLK